MKRKALLLLIPFCCLSLSLLYANPDSDLIVATKKGDMEGVKTAVTNGADIKATDEDGNMALNHAFFWPEITSYLLEHGADPNAGTSPPLILACSHYSTDVIKILLDGGADPNKIGKIKYDPGAEIRAKIAAEEAKGFAANKGNIAQWNRMLETMQPSLVDAKAMDVTVRQTNCAPCIDMLFAKGAHKQPKDNYGQGTLINTFVMFGMPPEQRNELLAGEVGSLEGLGYKTPDWLASLPADRNSSEADVIKALVAAGIDVNATNARGQTALHQTINGEFGIKPTMMKALVDNGADMSIPDPVYGTPLVMALKSGNVELMDYLVSQGVDISAESVEEDKQTGQKLTGMTPLMISTMYDQMDLVKYFVKKGAGYTPGAEGKAFSPQKDCLMDVKKKNALYFAIDNGNIEMVRWYVNQSKLGRPPTIMEVPVTEPANGCFAAGKYKPSAYARAMGEDDIYKFLKVKGW